jgi:hypothetical protein
MRFLLCVCLLLSAVNTVSAVEEPVSVLFTNRLLPLEVDGVRYEALKVSFQCETKLFPIQVDEFADFGFTAPECPFSLILVQTADIKRKGNQSSFKSIDNFGALELLNLATSRLVELERFTSDLEKEGSLASWDSLETEGSPAIAASPKTEGSLAIAASLETEGSLAIASSLETEGSLAIASSLETEEQSAHSSSRRADNLSTYVGPFVTKQCAIAVKVVYRSKRSAILAIVLTKGESAEELASALSQFSSFSVTPLDLSPKKLSLVKVNQ